MANTNKKSELMLMRRGTDQFNLVCRLSWSISSDFGAVHS